MRIIVRGRGTGGLSGREMMRAPVLAAIVAALTMAGCDKIAMQRPALATVGNERISDAQLNAELKAGEAPQPNNPQVRAAALDQIITRKLLAQAARAERLDQTPENIVMKGAAVEAFEAGLELRAIRDKVATP